MSALCHLTATSRGILGSLLYTRSSTLTAARAGEVGPCSSLESCLAVELGLVQFFL